LKGSTNAPPYFDKAIEQKSMAQQIPPYVC
jgi:hypothetical protein